jgi:hypothetical protein
VTKEQWIIVGFLAAAFVAGWLARSLSGWRERRRGGSDLPTMVLDEDLQRSVDATRAELDRAIRSYMAALAVSVRARETEPAEPDSLTAEVSAALQDDAANDCMVSALDDRREPAVSERELDVADWGFAYGVAWARARDRRFGDREDAVAREALRAAQSVFSSYAAESDWRFPAGNGDGESARQGEAQGRAKEEVGHP